MSCALTWLSVCLIDPSNAYLTVGVSSQLQADPDEGRWCADHYCRGPLGELRIGMRVEISPRFELDYGLRHTSFIKDNDRGEESFYASVTWRPFK